VSVDSTLPNRLAYDLLLAGKVRGVRKGSVLRREVPHGRSRFDFLAEPNTFVEVKSVTLVENGVARFPDAPTVRGARHVRELAEMVRDGGRAMVLFVVQRDDAVRVEPNRPTDPDFADALTDARRAGVMLRACRFRLDDNGNAVYAGTVPVRS
jgi:sugar fermentation stimulation protein A